MIESQTSPPGPSAPSSRLAAPSQPAALARDPRLALVHRATFGYTPAEYDRARQLGFEGWRDEQLDPESIDDSALDAQLAGLPTLGMSALELFQNYPQPQGDIVVASELVAARVLRARYSNRQLLERTVEFWTDHFNVDHADGPVRYFKTVDDREVIRQHALGSFRDLLGASAKSAAMLFYLDNYSNIASAPNENYARELLELHTLSSGGGYTETDVIEVARCFTGWTIDQPGGLGVPGTFRFLPGNHDNGPKVVLGQAIPAGGGQQDGETVLDILASHPSTAAFLARKLCVFFLVYDPPQVTVDRVAQRFLATAGDLAETLREVLSERSFQEADIWNAYKLKRPFDLVISSLRALGGEIQTPLGLNVELRDLGQLPYAWPAPNGYPDALGAWGSDVLGRWRFASRLLEGQIQGTGIPLTSMGNILAGVPVNQAARAINAALTGGRASGLDQSQVQAFIDGQPAFNVPVARQAVALFLSSPSFQWL